MDLANCQGHQGEYVNIYIYTYLFPSKQKKLSIRKLAAGRPGLATEGTTSIEKKTMDDANK